MIGEHGTECLNRWGWHMDRSDMTDEDTELEDLPEGDEEPESEDEADESEDTDDGEGDDGDSDGIDVDALVGQIEERLAERFDSVADRRVNAILKEIRSSEGQKKEPGGEPVVGDKRTARLAAREYLSDDIDFRSKAEREGAMDLVKLEIDALGAFDDEDEVGREVADRVAKRVRSQREMYESQTKSSLKRTGALKERKGQPKQGGGQTSASSEFQKGAEIARRFRTDETVS